MMMKPRYLAVAIGLILSSAAQGADISASAIEARFAAMEKRLQLAESRAAKAEARACLLYTSPSPRDRTRSRMPSSA